MKEKKQQYPDYARAHLRSLVRFGVCFGAICLLIVVALVIYTSIYGPL